MTNQTNRPEWEHAKREETEAEVKELTEDTVAEESRELPKPPEK